MHRQAHASTGRLRAYAAEYAAARDLRRAQEEATAARLDAEQARSSKAAFLSGLNHELRTPLNHITGFAGLLRQAPDLPEEKQAEYLDCILDSAGELLRLIDAILEAAAGPDQRRQVTPAANDPLPILRRLLHEHSGSLFVGKVDISDDLPQTDVSTRDLYKALQRIFAAFTVKSHERLSIGLSVTPDGAYKDDVAIGFELLGNRPKLPADVLRSVQADVLNLGLKLEDRSEPNALILALILPGESRKEAA